MRTLSVTAALVCAAVAAAGEVPAGFKPLFDGKTLEGWTITGNNKKAWRAEDGVLVTEGGGGGWLLTDKEYGDFELMLEYRLPKMGNSGVAIRSPLKGNPAYAGMELQILDDVNYLKKYKLRPTQLTGSVYDVIPAKDPRKINKPLGEWNKMHIVVKGPRVTVDLNGDRIVDGDLSQHMDKADRHPGLKRQRGRVGVQNHGTKLEFRNFYIKPME